MYNKIHKTYKTKSNRKPSRNQNHDKGYKGVLAKKKHFLHFLRKYIGAPWVFEINPNDIQRVDKSFITREYRNIDSDLIYKLNFKGSDVYFYVLLESQSSVDYTMPFRLLRYIVELLNDIFMNTDKKIRSRKDFKLPAIVPIILYNGDDNWTAAGSYREYTQNSEVFGDNIINFSYLLFDLNKTDEQSIMSTRKLLDIIFAVDKIRPANDYKQASEKLVMASDLSDDDINDLLGWIEYIFLKGDITPEFEQEFKETVKKGDVNIMARSFERFGETQYKQGRAEGRKEGMQKGMQKGIQEAIKKMRKHGLPEEEIRVMFGDIAAVKTKQ